MDFPNVNFKLEPAVASGTECTYFDELQLHQGMAYGMLAGVEPVVGIYTGDFESNDVVGFQAPCCPQLFPLCWCTPSWAPCRMSAWALSLW